MRTAKLAALTLLVASSACLANAPDSAGSGGPATAEAGSPAAHFKGLNLKVGSVARSMDFYRNIIGLKLARTISDGSRSLPQVLMTEDGRFDLRTSTYLALKEVAPGELAPPDERPRFGLINFLVADTATVAARAKAAGFAFRQSPNNIVVVTDPDGYAVELVQDH